MLGTDQSLFLGPEESEDDASWRTSLLKKLGQFEYYGITTGIIVGPRVHPQRIRTSRTRILTSHTQMVIVRANDDVFIPQLLVLSRKHGDDVMGSPLHFFPVGEVMIVTFFLLSLDHGLELQTAKLADDIFRGEGITRSAWVSATQFLRSQIFHRLSHVILLLSLSLHGKHESQGQYHPFSSHHF